MGEYADATRLLRGPRRLETPIGRRSRRRSGRSRASSTPTCRRRPGRRGALPRAGGGLRGALASRRAGRATTASARSRVGPASRTTIPGRRSRPSHRPTTGSSTTWLTDVRSPAGPAWRGRRRQVDGRLPRGDARNDAGAPVRGADRRATRAHGRGARPAAGGGSARRAGEPGARGMSTPTRRGASSGTGPARPVRRPAALVTDPAGLRRATAGSSRSDPCSSRFRGGTDDGEQIRLEGEGHAGGLGGAPGDVVVRWSCRIHRTRRCCVTSLRPEQSLSRRSSSRPS